MTSRKTTFEKRTIEKMKSIKIKDEKMTFEEAIDRLEEIVTQLEAGDISLDKALKAFEEGISLVKSCGRQLHQAEKKVERLSQQALELFKTNEEDQAPS